MSKRKRQAFGKAWALVTAAAMTAALAGCGDSAQTREEIVIPKETQQHSAAVQETGGGNIRKQVQAPAQWQESFGDDRITVTAAAPVIIPEAEGFRTKKVTSRVFTQEDYDAVKRMLLGDGPLWDRDRTAMSGSNGFTRQEIEERIAQLESEKTSGEKGSIMYGGEEIDYDEKIAEWKKMREAAPDEAQTTEIPEIVNYNEETPEQNWLLGNVTVNGQDYFVALNNNLQEDWRWIDFKVNRSDLMGNFMAAQDIQPDTSELQNHTAEIRDKAVKIVKDLGFTDFLPAGEEFMVTLSGDEEHNGEIMLSNVGYGIHFTRVIDGIPVTYTHADGNASEGDWAAWPYESVDIVFDEKGLASFAWNDPYQMEELSDENVFLLPFEDIGQIAREMFLKKYADFYKEMGWKIDFQIDEVRLGYMRVTEKGNPEEGTMIPVWDFFGSRTVGDPKGDESMSAFGPYESWLTINAMDGTIIDRDLGY